MRATTISAAADGVGARRSATKSAIVSFPVPTSRRLAPLGVSDGVRRPLVVNYHGGGWIAGTKEASFMSLLPWLEMGWNDSQAGYSFTISPGFYKANESSPRLTRDLTRWNQDIQDMIASGAPFQLVSTFNEWGEGTAVESAEEWASSSGYGAYLDALHDNGAGP